MGYPDSENRWVDESDITPDLIKSFNSMTKRGRSNPSQTSSATQTFDPQGKTSSPAVNRESLNENNQNNDSYFEEGYQNFDINVQLQSTTEDFQLFSIRDVIAL